MAKQTNYSLITVLLVGTSADPDIRFTYPIAKVSDAK